MATWPDLLKKVEDPSPGEAVVATTISWFTDKLNVAFPGLAEGDTGQLIEDKLPKELPVQACVIRRVLRAVKAVAQARRVQQGSGAASSAQSLSKLLVPGKVADVAVGTDLSVGNSADGVEKLLLVRGVRLLMFKHFKVMWRSLVAIHVRGILSAVPESGQSFICSCSLTDFQNLGLVHGLISAGQTIISTTVLILVNAMESAVQEAEEERSSLKCKVKEAIPELLKIFVKIDKDESGIISRDEMASVHENVLPRRLMDSACVGSILDFFDFLDVDEKGELLAVQSCSVLFTFGRSAESEPQ
ncbi:unnamed protein product [Durusdinium trenchii]|uniref:EF-hand domain-containing protein n=1 Tax=Durusdinium trenchii TaxID=1381693 RepID=A0ABP0PZQ4_9DINO